MQKNILQTIGFGALAALQACTSSSDTQSGRPNILIIYADDLGFGDIGFNGAKGVKTPNIDRLAMNGVNFTDAHCTAATSTPSRFSLLTGSYAFRSNAAILPGDAPLLIDPEKGTLAAMLQKAGYKTAVVGKWHLGLGRGEVDWNKEIKPGPREVGFDYSFLIPATADRVPCVYIENQHVVGTDINDPVTVSYVQDLEGYPTGTNHPELLRFKADLQHSNTIVNGIGRIGFMKGGKKALWVDEDFPVLLTDKAMTFIEENREQPFFLYFALTDVHVPRVPNPMFIGKSTMGPRGDVIAEMDWCVGQLMQKIEDLGLTEKTLVVFSSDNGPVLNDGYDDLAAELLGEHQPAGPFRGGKYSAFEGGTRVPTIVSWPGVVKPGISDALVNQIDLYASLAKLTGQIPGVNDAPDSEEFLNTWLGKSAKGRKSMLEEAFTLAFREGEWKYINPIEKPTPEWLKNKDVETALSNEVQLYNLQNDQAERVNIASKNPERVKEMQEQLKKIRQEKK